MHGVIPRLEWLYDKFAFARHAREPAWVFICRVCGDEYVFPCGELTARALCILRNHKHVKEERR